MYFYGMEKYAFNTIKASLKAAGMSQTELAARLEISKQAMSDLCNNRAQPSLNRLFQIAALIGCSPQDLLAKKNPFAEK